MREVERLQRELQATVEGDPWYGSALWTLLDGVDAAAAAAHPVPGSHSIWELVVHMTAWTNETRRRIQGGANRTPAEGDWPAVTAASPSAWQAARDALRHANDELGHALLGIADGDLDRQVGGAQVDAHGQPVTYHQTVVGLLQHHAYHGGQVAILARRLGR